MRIVGTRALRRCWEKHNQARKPLQAWHAIVEKAMWDGPQDIRNQFGSADFVANNRVIFNIGGNKFRLVALVAYGAKAVYVKFADTHAEYDKIDPATV